MYQKIIIIIGFMGLVACGTTNDGTGVVQSLPSQSNPPPSSCTVTKTNNGATISCPDGTTAAINNGANGSNGLNGSNGYGIPGQAGKSCTVVQMQNGALITCQDGSSAVVSNGLTGPAGTPGGSCSVTSVPAASPAPNGGALISCPDGSGSLVLNGSNGANGLPGTPGTLISPVQFCPGTTTYPSVFVEVGFCINNDIWAVYSANNGFMTKIPPGAYSSNAIGSSCNFTVLPNCKISN